MKASTSLLCSLAAIAAFPALAKEDIEFVQEHLPEVAMDNRYATLPVWHGGANGADDKRFVAQGAYSFTNASALQIRGPLLSIGSHWNLRHAWQLTLFGFYDTLQLAATRETRDLQTLFAPSTPIDRPVAAEFTNLDGTMTDIGAGVSFARAFDSRWFGEHRWLGGALWQRVTLDDCRFDYRLTAGPQSGLAGTIDFDATYVHVAPFIGFEQPRDHGRWATSLHVLAVYPLPRRGIVGHITGPGFDIRGDTAKAGSGKHFGDPSLTVGYALIYKPAHLSIDLGTLVSQVLLEPYVHRGIDRDLVLSFAIGF
jgi:hypothetical protein